MEQKITIVPAVWHKGLNERRTWQMIKFVIKNTLFGIIYQVQILCVNKEKGHDVFQPIEKVIYGKNLCFLTGLFVALSSPLSSSSSDVSDKLVYLIFSGTSRTTEILVKKWFFRLFWPKLDKIVIFALDKKNWVKNSIWQFLKHTVFSKKSDN